MHPGAHPDMVQWLIDKKIKIWGRRCIDRPSMNLPIGRFLVAHGQCDRVPAAAEKIAVKKLSMLFPEDHYQLTHNALFKHNCLYMENLGGQIGARSFRTRD